MKLSCAGKGTLTFTSEQRHHTLPSTSLGYILKNKFKSINNTRGSCTNVHKG